MEELRYEEGIARSLTAGQTPLVPIGLTTRFTRSHAPLPRDQLPDWSCKVNVSLPFQEALVYSFHSMI